MLRFPVAILAGGLATRLRPLTETIPKAMIPINGEPFVAHQLRLLRRQGCAKAVICAGRFAEAIRDFAGDGSAFGLRIAYSYDGERLLGTAGALRRALPSIDADACFVLYGDSYLPCDFAPVECAFLAQGKPALMTVFRNEGAWDSSNVEFQDGVIRHYSKTDRTLQMRYIDYGLGILSRAVIESIPDGQPSDLAPVYERLVESGEMGAFEVRERFYEAGSFQGVAELSEFLRQTNG